MQEIVNSSGGDKLDGRIDKINNEIGIQYGLNNPTMPKNQLFDLLVKDHTKNLNYRNQQLAGE
jgi:hypothetical protein